jgi:hypothetical protein
MTNEEAIQWMRKLVLHDTEGKVMPSDEALRKIESSYPNSSDAEIWGLACYGPGWRSSTRTADLSTNFSVCASF